MYLTVLTVSAGFYLAYQEWLSWLTLLAVLYLPLFSFLVSLPAMLRLEAGVIGPDRILMEGSGEVKLVGWCSLPVPPFRGKLRVTRTLTGEQWPSGTVESLPTEHCGGLTVVPEKVRVYDYLGLIGIRVRKTETKTILVLPRPVEIPSLPELDRFMARSWRPKPGGGFSENHELRLYRPGDNLNQVHWKLTAKTGKLILREPMQPNRGLVLVTMNLRGTAEELDRKLGRLLWLGEHLLGKEVGFALRVLTGDGIRSWNIDNRPALEAAVHSLLRSSPAISGDLRQAELAASWHYHIGGGADGS